MSVSTKSVTGRRPLKFSSMNEMVADAEQLVAAPSVAMLGNWPLEKLFTHLAMAINGSIDGVTAKAPWYVRLAGPLIKRRILTHGMPAGFNLAKGREATFFPAAPSSQSALDILRQAAQRTHAEQMTSAHPVFGPLTHDEWLALHLRHAELHLSFAVPGS